MYFNLNIGRQLAYPSESKRLFFVTLGKIVRNLTTNFGSSLSGEELGAHALGHGEQITTLEEWKFIFQMLTNRAIYFIFMCGLIISVKL